MQREKALDLCARLGEIIARHAPTVPYTRAEVAAHMMLYSERERAEMAEMGLCTDEACYYVMSRFWQATGLDEEADGEFVLRLFGAARRLSARAFREDPYLCRIPATEAREGPFLLTRMHYERGEIFQYDMPDLGAACPVLRLGFFDGAVSFPALYEGNIPWVSVCPSEINSMAPDIAAAHGDVLVLGLGLGYYPLLASLSPEVRSLTVVELRPEVISLFRRHLLPHFPHPEKIRLVQGDAIAYMRSPGGAHFDFCFADIWEGAVDGAPLYRAIRETEPLWPGTEFRYWIGAQIEAYLQL